jgi:hypothetical protein
MNGDHAYPLDSIRPSGAVSSFFKRIPRASPWAILAASRWETRQTYLLKRLAEPDSAIRVFRRLRCWWAGKGRM